MEGSEEGIETRRNPGFSSVLISADLTSIQRIHRKKLLHELKARRAEGDDVVLLRNQIVMRDSIKRQSFRSNIDQNDKI